MQNSSVRRRDGSSSAAAANGRANSATEVFTITSGLPENMLEYEKKQRKTKEQKEEEKNERKAKKEEKKRKREREKEEKEERRKERELEKRRKITQQERKICQFEECKHQWREELKRKNLWLSCETCDGFFLCPLHKNDPGVEALIAEHVQSCDHLLDDTQELEKDV